ncbi:glycosyltransferase family 39 protein [Nostoc sp. C117]|uniref:glycosyltransferase family 39 protein n=1 Tax=Nostoc sp. C117 TaxID=3349875 RepID=UPI00370DE139
MQKLWLVFGQSEAALRSLSAIVGTINIPLLYGLGRVLGGHWLGLVASALLATSRINIQYSQEARGYALLTAAATLSIWGLAYLLTLPHKPTVLIGQGLINTLRRNSFSTQAYWNNLTSDLAWIAYIIGVSIALYCHNTAVLLPILANVVVLVWWATKGCFSKKFFLNWSVANVIWILIWSWWIPKIIQQTAVTLSDFWIPYPTIQIFFTTLISLYGSEYYLLLISGLAVLGILYWRHQPTKSGLTVTLSIGTILLGFLISFKRSIFITKIFLWTTIPFFVLVAAGILYFRKRSLIAISIAILIIIQLFFTSKYYKYSKKEPWNEVGFYVQSLVQPKDTILLFPSTIDSAFQYYFHSPKREVTQYGLRRWSFNIPRLPSTKVTEIKRSELLNIVQRFSRIWLVVRNREFEDPQNLAISDIDQKMTQLSQKSFDQKIEIFLFEKNNTK